MTAIGGENQEAFLHGVAETLREQLVDCWEEEKKKKKLSSQGSVGEA
jgi:hypothetical protein